MLSIDQQELKKRAGLSERKVGLEHTAVCQAWLDGPNWVMIPASLQTLHLHMMHRQQLGL